MRSELLRCCHRLTQPQVGNLLAWSPPSEADVTLTLARHEADIVSGGVQRSAKPRQTAEELLEERKKWKPSEAVQLVRSAEWRTSERVFARAQSSG
jgi:hypothetical protein